jgi:hypothetical protein
MGERMRSGWITLLAGERDEVSDAASAPGEGNPKEGEH